MTLRELTRQFLEHLEIEKNRSQKTLENYKHYLDRFLTITRAGSPDQINNASVRNFRLQLNRLRDQDGQLLKKKYPELSHYCFASISEIFSQTRY